MRHILALVMIMSLGFYAQAKTAGNHGKAVAKKAVAKKGKTEYKVVRAFNTRMFGKMTHSQRKQYFKIYNDYLVTSEVDGRVSSFNIMELILPMADARDYLRNAGFIVPGNYASNEKFDTTALLKSFPSSCSDSQKYPEYVSCYPGIGLTADNKAFCVKNDSGQTTACSKLGEAKNANGNTGVEQLVKYINENANSIDPVKSREMGDLKQILGTNISSVQSKCDADKGTSFCKTLTKSLSGLEKNMRTSAVNLDDLVKDAVAVTTPPATSVTDNEVGKVMSNSCAKALESSLSKVSNKPLDARWSAAVLLARQVCPNTKGVAENAFKRFGICYAKAGGSSAPGDAVKGILESASPGLKMNGQQSTQFTNYFGMNPVQFKATFCDTNDSRSFADALKKLDPGSVVDQKAEAESNGMAQALRDIRKKENGVTNPDYNKFKAGLVSMINDMEAGRKKYSSRSPEVNRRVIAMAKKINDYVNGKGRDGDSDAIASANIEEVMWLGANLETDSQQIWASATSRALKDMKDANTTAVPNKALYGEAKKALESMQKCVDDNIKKVETVGKDTGYNDTNEFSSNYNTNCSMDGYDPKESRASVLYSDARDGAAPIVVMDKKTARCYMFESFDKASNKVHVKDPSNDETASWNIDEMTSKGLEIRNFTCRDTPATEDNQEGVRPDGDRQITI